MLVTIGTCRVKREKASLSVDVLCSKTPLLKFPNKIPRISREHVVQDADCTFLGSYCINFVLASPARTSILGIIIFSLINMTSSIKVMSVVNIHSFCTNLK